MTLEETGKLVDAYGRWLGPDASTPDTGGILLPSGIMMFCEYTDRKAFVCRVEVFDFTNFDPTPAEIEEFHKEERSGTPTGGGHLEWVPETQRLFLTRTYVERVDEKTFIADMDKLAHAGHFWSDEVTGNVMDRINEKRRQRASP